MNVQRTTHTILAALAVILLLSATNALAEEAEEKVSSVGKMFDLSSRELLNEVVSLFKEYKISPDELDKENGVMVTYWRRLKSKTLPGLDPPKMRDRVKMNSFQYHVYVPQFVEPGRVYVGVITEGLGNLHHHSHGIDDMFQSWMFDRLSEHLGKDGEPIPPDGAARLALERKHRGDDTPRDCDRHVGAEPLIPGFDGVSNPTVIDASRIEPMNTERFKDVKSGSLLLQALIDEEGRVVDVEILRNLTDSEEFADDAANRVAFWRYHPAELDGCPVPVKTMISVEF
jgi:hypothetical protein